MAAAPDPAVTPAGPLTAHLWEVTSEVRARIDGLELLRGLADGSLPPRTFVRYLQQDGLYLADYRRALAMLASRAPRPDGAGLWAGSVVEATAEETSMQDGLLADPDLAPHVRTGPRSTLVTRAYAASLLAAAAYEPYPVGVAAVLPCFWVYADVGARLASRVRPGIPRAYAAWIDQYGGPAFARTARRAVAELERAASSADAETMRRVEAAFAEATRFEEMFWSSAADETTPQIWV